MTRRGTARARAFFREASFYFGGRAMFRCDECGTTTGPWDYLQYRWVPGAHTCTEPRHLTCCRVRGCIFPGDRTILDPGRRFGIIVCNHHGARFADNGVIVAARLEGWTYANRLGQLPELIPPEAP